MQNHVFRDCGIGKPCQQKCQEEEAAFEHGPTAYSSKDKPGAPLSRRILCYCASHHERLVSKARRTDWVTCITVEALIPLVVAPRSLTAAGRASIKATVHQALHKLAKRGTI